jgi:phage shock protein A
MIHLQSLRAKCDSLGRGLSTLEDKCTALSSTVDSLNVQLERSLHNESDLQSKVSQLSRSLNATSSTSHEIQVYAHSGI